jgi:hypothetical protein
MVKLIRFPRKNPYRKWSPEQILAIPEPPDTRTLASQERSRIAAAKTIQAKTGNRDKNRMRKKQAIINILSHYQRQTITTLMELLDRNCTPVSRPTLTRLLKELQAEGQVFNTGLFWSTSISH